MLSKTVITKFLSTSAAALGVAITRLARDEDRDARSPAARATARSRGSARPSPFARRVCADNVG